MKCKKLSARILSFMLTVAMLLGMLPMTVLAAEGDATLDAISTGIITGFDELGEGLTRSVPFDGHTYVLDVKPDTPFEAIQLPTELGVMVEIPLEDTPDQEEAAVTEVTQETILVTWKGDRAYTPDQNSKVMYTAVLPEGYTRKDGVALPQIYVFVGKQARTRAATTPQEGCEAITIAKESLNGNTVWGLTEASSGISLDGYAGLYVKSASHNGRTGGLPPDGSLLTKNGIPYQLAVGADPAKAYDGNDSIHLKPNYTSQTMDLQTIGAYEKIYVLATAGGPGTGNFANFKVKLTYTDDTTSETAYKLYDWYDKTPVSGVEQYDNIYRFNNKGSFEKDVSGAPILHSATISADSGKLLKSISFTMAGKNTGADVSGLFCGIYAITGAVSAGAPARPTTTTATHVNDGETPRFTANWTIADKATGYRLDVSERENFTTLVNGYNNLLIEGGDTISHRVTGLTPNTTYYYRVRAVNAFGQSLGSNRIATDLPTWVKKAGLRSTNAEYDLETGTLKLNAGAVLTAPLQLPADSVITLDLNGQQLTPPVGQPSITAADGSVVELKLTDSSNPSTPPTLSGGSGKPAIDFSKAAAGSKVSLGANTSVQGGKGVGNLSGGDGVMGGPGTSITLDAGAAATGGKGGEHGGKGGNGLTGGTITLAAGAAATGGQGGSGAATSIPAGTGGIGADAKSITGSGSATGGQGGNGPTPGTGGVGAKVGTYSGITVAQGKAGENSVNVNITGLTAPTPQKMYDGSPVSKTDFGTAAADNDYDATTLTYTYYKASGESLGELLSEAPKDAGDYILVVSTPTTDTVNVGQVTLPFPITKAPYSGTEAVALDASKATKTDKTVILSAQEESGEVVEYGFSTTADGAITWQDTTTFTGLTANTDYYFFARVKATTNYEVGAISVGTQITTNISDADKLTAAKIKVQTYLLEMKATKDTESADVLAVVNAALSKVGTEGITARWKASPDGFNKTLATEIAAGSIKGKITLMLNSSMMDVDVHFPIARLIADKTALKEAINTANKAKNDISINNNAIENVPNGTTFVSAAEMKALADAIAAAQTVANSTIATSPNVHAAISTLSEAVEKFKKAIQTGKDTSSTHKPVGNITIALTTATAGTDLLLTGMVTPADASSKTIAWSIKDAGTTGATMTDNKLSTIAAGTVVVTATITSGVAASTSYTQDFTIAVLAASGTASGTLKHESGLPVKDATVTLMQGDEEKYTIQTDEHGNYSFADVPNGIYKIVINTKNTPAVTFTDTVTVAGGATKGKDLAVLDGNKSTLVVITEGTPNVAVGGMNDLLDASNIGTMLTGAEQMAVVGSGSVELRFVVDKKTGSEVGADQGLIEVAATGQKIDMFLDLSVLKTVKDVLGTVISTEEKVPNLATTIVAQIPIPASMQGKADLSVYRVHNGNAEALQKDLADANGEYYSISNDSTFITLHIKNFSTYALAYTAYTVGMTDGGTGASGASSYGSGETVTINAGSKSGYSFDGWTVTSGTVTLANASSTSTTFAMPREHVTVKANWKSSGGGSNSTTTYHNTVNKPENGTVSITPTSPSKGQTVTITTKPHDGYVVDQVRVTDAGSKTIAVTAKGMNGYTFVQPAEKLTVEVTYKMADTGSSQAFVDVTTSNWFYDAVMTATGKGWFNGTSYTTFSPNAPTSRGMIATILHRIEGTPHTGKAAFNDVAADAYYTNGIAWAETNSIVRGYGNGNYGPNDHITREQLAAMLYRYATFKGYDMSKTATLDSFADASSVSGYAEDAMSWAVGSGLISGRGNNALAPTATATRAEVAVVLVRFEESLTK